MLDTGPLYATLDRSDGAHVAARRLVETAREPLIIPAPVLVEVDQLTQGKQRPSAFTGLLQDVKAGFYEVSDLLPEDYDRVLELCERYLDSGIGFVDAAVLAIVERLNEPKLATLDRRHFGILRPRHVDALTLLPE